MSLQFLPQISFLDLYASIMLTSEPAAQCNDVLYCSFPHHFYIQDTIFALFLRRVQYPGMFDLVQCSSNVITKMHLFCEKTLKCVDLSLTPSIHYLQQIRHEDC